MRRFVVWDAGDPPVGIDPDRTLVGWDDAPWIAAADAQALPSSRAPEFRALLAELIDRWCALLAERVPAAVVDTARYRLAGDLAPLAHRAWILGRLRAAGADDVRWVGASADDGATALVRSCAAAGLTLSIDASAVAVPTSRRWARRIRGAMWTAARLLRPRHRHLEPRPLAFVEHYPVGCRAAVVVADAAGRHDAPAWVLTTSLEASAVASPLVVPAVEASSRGIRARALFAGRRIAPAVRASSGDLVRAVGEPFALLAGAQAEITSALTRTLVESARTTGVVRGALAAVRPKVVATTSYTSIAARSAVATARVIGARRTCYVQHAVLFRHNVGAHLRHDRYLVWGERDRRGFVERGIAPCHIIVTGAPSLDAVAARSSQGAGRSPERPFTVAYLPSRTDGDFVTRAVAERFLDWVLHALEPTWQLVVKVHPLDRSGVHDGLARPGARVERQGDALELMAGADAVIVATSNAGYEACALDRDVVVLTTAGVPADPVYAELGAALVADGPESLRAALDAIHGDPETSSALAAGRAALVEERFAGARPGAADRAATALLAD